MEQQTQSGFVSTPSNVLQSDTKINNEPKPKLTNIESFFLILLTLYALLVESFVVSYDIIEQIKIYLLWGWMIVGIVLLYKKFGLFSGKLSQDENSKLSIKEKIIIFIFSIIEQSVVGLIATFVWYKSKPNKARRANLIAVIVLFAKISLLFVTSLFLAK